MSWQSSKKCSERGGRAGSWKATCESSEPLLNKLGYVCDSVSQKFHLFLFILICNTGESGFIWKKGGCIWKKIETPAIHTNRRLWNPTTVFRIKNWLLIHLALLKVFSAFKKAISVVFFFYCLFSWDGRINNCTFSFSWNHRDYNLQKGSGN